MMKFIALLSFFAILVLIACKATAPGDLESRIADETKKMTLGGKNLKNPIADTPESVKEGASHFQHHCQICHGLDGHNTGVPFADKMSPAVADLAEKDVQEYTDGQLKWIIENGIRFTGMPGWKGILDDQEMWHIVHFIRHLPAKGSLGAPAVYKESEEQHEEMGKGAQPGKAPVPPSKRPATRPHEHPH